MRQLVLALRRQGCETAEEAYRACAQLQAAGAVPVLEVVPPDVLRERVEATCEDLL